MNRRILSIAIVAGALAAAAGATFALRASSSNEQPPAALQRARVASDALPAAALAAASQRELATAQSRMIATDTYLVPTQSASDLCLVSLLGNEMRATCNPESRFFNGRQFVYLIGEEGAPSSLTGLTIAGVARPAVAEIEAVFPGGITQSVTPSPDGGFTLAATPTALSAGEPTSISALDQAGRVLEAEPGPSK